MGRMVKEARITTRAARIKLPVSKTVHWRAIDRGAHLGYRKGTDGGTWVARFRRADGKYVTRAVGKADDALDADGGTVLDYYQALKRAREWCAEQARPFAEKDTRTYTVADACRDYLDWYEVHRKAFSRVKNMIESDIVPGIGSVRVVALTPNIIETWHRKLAASPAKIRTPMGKPQRYRDDSGDADAPRRRKLTANRILAVLKAALMHAYKHGKVASDDAWRRVEPFKNVISARIRYLSREEAVRLLNACRLDFRQLVRGALLTGLRYGEITRLRVRDYVRDAGTVLIQDSKSGTSRHVVLTAEGQQFFEQLTAGRSDNEPTFLKRNGKPWSTAEQHRPLANACNATAIKDVTFHALRHTHASWLAMSGVPTAVITHQLGHADQRMAEKHYAHLAPSYIADTIRANLPQLGIVEESAVTPLKPRRAK